MKGIKKEINRSYHKFTITIFLVICFVIGAVLLIIASQQMTDGIEDMGGEIPEKIKEAQEAYLRRNEALLKVMGVKMKEIQQDTGKSIKVEEIKELINNYGEILRVENAKMYAVVDNEFYAFDDVEHSGNYTEKEWYKKVIEAEENEIIYTDARNYNNTKEIVVTAAMKVAGTNDILAVNIFPEQIVSWSDIADFPQGTCYYITDSKGKILHQDKSELDINPAKVKEYIDEVYAELGVEADEIPNISFIEQNTNNRAGLYTAQTYNGWRIVIRIPYEDMLDETKIVLIAYYITTVLFSILILYLAFSERRAERGKLLYRRISDVLSDSYYAIYIVDYEKEQYTIMKGSEYIKSIPQTGSYNSFIEIMANVMEEGAYKEFKETFSIENIRRLVNNNVKSFGGDYKRAFNSEFKWVNVSMLYSKKNVKRNRPEVIFAFQEVDARKEKEEEEKEVLRESMETIQLATQTKNRFFSNMSHDMRTPLNAIINFSNMAKESNDRARVMDYLTKINISSSQLLELINNILEVSKIEENMPLIAKTQFNLTKGLVDIFSVFKEQAVIQQKNLEVIYNVKHNYVFSDWGKIRQIINNVVSNALKYTRKNGNIHIEVNEIEGKFISKYTFRIVDDGIGMSKEFLKKIYTPFERETRFHSEEMNGTGLGMVIVQNNIQALNGQIEINSEPGKGCDIHIVLPLETSKEIEETNENKYEKEDLQDLKGKRILLVEDNELNMEIATEILEMQGVKITQAFDGNQAVEIFRQSMEGYFDAILMDIQMPIMDGHEATECIRNLPRKDAKSVIILAVTANAFAEDIIEAEKVGMNEHISKPIDFKELQKTLTKFMKKG